jgi:uncharacterized membrane protein
MTDAQVYAEAAVMGAVAGIRSMSAPAIVGQLSDAGFIPEGNSPVGWLQHPNVGNAFKVLASGESLADKLPFLPARTGIGPLAARAITGSVGGAAICGAAKRPWWIGALIGAAAAVAASFGATRLRKWISEQHNVPNTVVGLIEDAVVTGAGQLIVASFKNDKAIEA